MNNLTLNTFRKIFFLFISLLFLSSGWIKAVAQTPNMVWAKQIGGSGEDYGFGITVDSANNIYATGAFKGTVDFDPNAGVYNLTSTSGLGPDIYVEKLNANGKLVWAKQFKGSSQSNSNEGMAVKYDSKGDLYITGTFTGKVDFDPGPDTFYLTAT